MEDNLRELFQNLQDEGYVDVYFVPDQDGNEANDFRADGIKYNPNDDWEWFCRNQLKLDTESVLLINEEENVFIKGNNTESSNNQQTITYQIKFK